MLLTFTVRRTNASQPLQSQIKLLTKHVQLMLSVYHSVVHWLSPTLGEMPLIG